MKETTPGGSKKIIIIVAIFVIVVGAFQSGLWFLSNNPELLPSLFRNSFGPAPTPVVENNNVVVNPTPAYIGTFSIVAPEFKVGGTIQSIDDKIISVNTLGGEVNVTIEHIDSFYLSTPDNVVVKSYETLDVLELMVGDLVSLIQNNDTYAIVKYVAVVE